VPSRVLHFAYDTSDARAQADPAAYEEIVEQRLQTIGECKVGGLPIWSSFLARRMKPTLRTCVTTDARQSSLSLKLARAANTRVDFELEQQNQELLKSMNARTRLQLRLRWKFYWSWPSPTMRSDCSDISSKPGMTAGS